MGIESIEGMCPRCQKQKTLGMVDSPQGPPPDGTSTAECARILLACLPDSVKDKRSLKNVATVNSVAVQIELVVTDASNDSSTQKVNLHWRSYTDQYPEIEKV